MLRILFISELDVGGGW